MKDPKRTKSSKKKKVRDTKRNNGGIKRREKGTHKYEY